MAATATVEWTHIEGQLVQIESDSKGNLWGVNAGHQIFFRKPYTHDWVVVPGLLNHVSVSQGPIPHVCGINHLHQFFIRTGITETEPMGTTWEKQNAPHFEHIAQGEAGTVWGCTAAHEIYFKTKTTDWVVVPGKLNMVSCGPHFQVWGCNHDDNIFVRQGTSAENPMGTDWHKIDGHCIYVSAGTNEAVCCNRAAQVFRKPHGGNWEKIPGALRKIHINAHGLVTGITHEGDNPHYTYF
ncbi:tectonin beta-propeller repeat-containing protein 1 [Pelomyxa schiedti]|nr:tectonin beta-propeller repeat-containing protein 1 [Pelomyxa schiedti]